MVDQTLQQSALLAGDLDTVETTAPIEGILDDEPQSFEDKSTFLFDHSLFFYYFFLSIWAFFHEHFQFTDIFLSTTRFTDT